VLATGDKLEATPNFCENEGMKRFVFLIVGFVFLALPKLALGADYEIQKFESVIEIQKDTKLLVTEKLNVNFFEKRHGIYRDIPVVYSADGKTINVKLKVLSVENENGENWPYTTSRVDKNLQIKIGDPDKYVSGLQNYEITYQVSGVIQRFPDHDELYWNAFGGGWEAVIVKGLVTVRSPWAEITKSTCFYGEVGTTGQECLEAKINGDEVGYISREELGYGRDMTVVVGLSKNNQLVFPGLVQQIGVFVADNWGYPVAFVPVIYMGMSWWKKGRDKRYLSEGVYYEPENKDTKTVSIFARKFIPMVYAPIDDLTPSEMGTIVDERVDTKDVVAEITELARLGYLKIKMLEKKKIIGKSTEYVFIKQEKDKKGLRDYQKFLLEKLFGDKGEVKMSELQDKFYKHLGEFKAKLYAHVHEREYFSYDPDKTRINWFLRWLVASGFTTVIIWRFTGVTGNFGPFVLFGIVDLISLPIAFVMPRKTAKGYSLHRQAKGLSFYLGKGKWRHEVNEKNLFFEEMLPLAIALGVVKKLAKDMEGLEVKPPSYFEGASGAYFYSGLGRFDSSLGTALASSPKSSSYGGGSGFSGGSVGGGFGGGGGGSW